MLWLDTGKSWDSTLLNLSILSGTGFPEEIWQKIEILQDTRLFIEANKTLFQNGCYRWFWTTSNGNWRVDYLYFSYYADCRAVFLWMIVPYLWIRSFRNTSERPALLGRIICSPLCGVNQVTFLVRQTVIDLAVSPFFPNCFLDNWMRLISILMLWVKSTISLTVLSFMTLRF